MLNGVSAFGWTDGPTKGNQNSAQNSRSPSWDLNPAPVEYEAGAPSFSFGLLISVRYCDKYFGVENTMG